MTYMNNASIIVAAYNQDAYLDRCIRSILDQTYVEYNLILVDDGSVDSSAFICDTAVRSQDNIIVVHQPNKGLSGARNTGIELNASCLMAEWLTFIDSDDWVNRRFMELMLNAVKDNNVHVVATKYRRTDHYDQVECLSQDVRLCTPEEFLITDRTLFSVACCKLYHASCFDSIRFPVGKLHEDEFTTYKVLFNEKNIVWLCFPLYNYFINPNSITQSQWNPQRLDVLEALLAQMEFFKKGGYKKAFHNTLHCYLWMLYDFSNKTMDLYPEISKELKRKFGVCFRKNKSMFSIEEYGYFYRFAFPTEYTAYLIRNKIVRLVRKNKRES